MTTIISTDQGFYSDSRVTASDTILTDKQNKIITYKEAVIATTGNPLELEKAIKLYLDGKLEKYEELEGCCLVRASSETRLISFHNGYVNDELDFTPRCYGSGRRWAVAALDFGKSPEDAIRYAMTKDIYSGGKINKFLFTDKVGGK